MKQRAAQDVKTCGTILLLQSYLFVRDNRPGLLRRLRRRVFYKSEETTLHTNTASLDHTVSNDAAQGESAQVCDRHLAPSLVWGLISLVVAARVVSYFFLRADSASTLVPRSFVGGGFQSMPAVLDLIVPVIVLVALLSRRQLIGSSTRWLRNAVVDAATFLLFPLVAGLTMFAYEGRWQVVPNVSLATSLRWLQFVAAYLAWNLLLDALHSRWQRIAATCVLAACLGFLQDLFPGTNSMYILLSVGLTLTWTVLALRRTYSQSPLAATAAASAIGAVACFLVVMAPSDALQTFLLSFIALPLGAIAVANRRWWLRWPSLAVLATIGLTLSLVVPRFVPPPERAAYLTQELPPAHTEQVEGITVSYDDIRVRQIVRQLAHVLAAANQVSREAYGVSPEVNTLVVRGIALGGFRAEFPHAIIGNFASAKQIQLSLDQSFLNGDPRSAADFPDPVNGILHEYSHLYGVVPYQGWVMGAEEEGWATFSATRLAHRLNDRFGPGLWSPPYDYASWADAITQTNLVGHAVYWSHPYEYGGFRLWNLLTEKHGEANLYRARWELTRRDYPGWWLQISDPAQARKMAAQLGFAEFASRTGTPVPYGQVYSLQDAERAEAMLFGSVEQTRTGYARREKRVVDPTIRVPVRKPARLDVVLSVCLLAFLAFLLRRVA